MKESILRSRSYLFAIRIVKLAQYLQIKQKEYVLSKQILKSGTAVGALIREAAFGQSKIDFAHKLSISLKEAYETDYWHNLLKDTGYINSKQFESLSFDCNELLKLLVASIKTTKNA